MKKKAAIIIQARVGSSRLPGKVLKEVLGKPLIQYVIERSKKAALVSSVTLATGLGKENLPLRGIAEKCGALFFAGSENDVLDRYYCAAKESGAETVVRVTGDCPLIDPTIIDETIELFMNSGCDYVANCKQPIYPDGLDVEVFRLESLEKAWKQAKKTSEREHVTLYIVDPKNEFRVAHVKKEFDFSHLRWTVDEAQDFEVVSRILEGLCTVKSNFGWLDVLSYVTLHPELIQLNKDIQRNEGLAKSLEKEGSVAQGGEK